MQLPPALRAALERLAAQYRFADLRQAHARLSERYRSGAPLSRLSEIELAAYALARLPATYAASNAVLSEALRRTVPAQSAARIASLLDLGAGLGALAWAAGETLATLERGTLLDGDAGMVRLGRQLASEADVLPVRQAEWLVGDMVSTRLQPHDLVACSYSLGELSPAAAAQTLQAAWAAARQMLVIIEPGTMAGFARVRAWREQLLGVGAHMVAPCPHQRPCPLGRDDWCHFAQRVERSALHRRLKEGSLGYEDEKFSYLVVSRTPLKLPAARITRHPQIAAGIISLQLCAKDGLREQVIRKKTPVEFRHARHARWGDAWPAVPAREA